jgi:hypothetical protein
MSEIKERYMNELPFEETCDTYCNYIENLKDVVDELLKEREDNRCLTLAELGMLQLDNEILNKENISLKKVLVEMKNENKGLRDKLIATIEKYSKEME